MFSDPLQNQLVNIYKKFWDFDLACIESVDYLGKNCQILLSLPICECGLVLHFYKVLISFISVPILMGFFPLVYCLDLVKYFI